MPIRLTISYYINILLTVGYGDITPISSAAKSIAILISLLGQLYMAVGIASFVGKFMANNNRRI